MGRLLKQYLKYANSSLINLVASPNVPVVVLPHFEGVHDAVVCAVAERVRVYNPRTREVALELPGLPGRVVTALALVGESALVVGVAPGHLVFYDLSSPTTLLEALKSAHPSDESTPTPPGCRACLHAHHATVQTLAANGRRHLLASGSMDTTVAVWDVAAAGGLFKLRGHKAPVTAVAFTADGRWLISGARDCLVKLWHVDSQHCFHTLATRTHLQALTLLADDAFLCAACVDEDMTVWRVKFDDGDKTDMKSNDELIVHESDAEQESDAGEGGEDSFGVKPAMKSLGEKKAKKRSSASGDLVSEMIAKREPIAWSTLDATVQSPVLCEKVGTLRWTGRGRVDTLTTATVAAAAPSTPGEADKQRRQHLLAAAGRKDRHVQVWRVADEVEVRKKRAKRAKKAVKKRQKLDEDNSGDGKDVKGDNDGEDGDEKPEIEEKLEDELPLAGYLKLPMKDSTVSQLTMLSSSQYTSLGIVCVTADNDVHEMRLAEPMRHLSADRAVTVEPGDDRRHRALSSLGHRQPARAVAISADEQTLLTCAAGDALLWSANSLQRVRRLPLMANPVGGGDGGKALEATCCAFLAGGRHAVIGCKSGCLMLVDLHAAEVLWQQEDAHESTIWATVVRNEGNERLLTASEDSKLKFWTLDVPLDAHKGNANDNDDAQRRVPTLSMSRSLLMDDPCLAVCVAPLAVGSGGATKRAEGAALLCVASLDTTIKVLYSDTCKLFITLYGHKLPVLCVDASDDGELLVSGAGDKNLRIWALRDFGDCRKAIFAHDEAVTSCRFLPRTHQVLSCSKDGTVKHWDVDTFTLVQRLCGGHVPRPCVALEVSSRGELAVSAGLDGAVRVWRRLQDELVVPVERLDEELERAELEFDRAPLDDVVLANEPALTHSADTQRLLDAATASVVDGSGVTAKTEGVCVATVADGATLDHVDAVMRAISLRNRGSAADPVLISIGCVSWEAYVLRTLCGCPSNQLDQIILRLPQDVVAELVTILTTLLADHHGSVDGDDAKVARTHQPLAPNDVATAARCLLLVARSFSAHQLAATSVRELTSLSRTLPAALGETVDMIGFNLAALRFAQAEISAREKEMTQFKQLVQKKKVAAAKKRNQVVNLTLV